MQKKYHTSASYKKYEDEFFITKIYMHNLLT